MALDVCLCVCREVGWESSQLEDLATEVPGHYALRTTHRALRTTHYAHYAQRAQLECMFQVLGLVEKTVGPNDFTAAYNHVRSHMDDNKKKRKASSAMEVRWPADE